MTDSATPTTGPAPGPSTATPPQTTPPTGRGRSRTARVLRGTGWSIGGLLMLLIVAVCLAEWAGWPFLARPMQSTLTKVLDRPVYLEGAMDPTAAGPAPAASTTAPTASASTPAAAASGAAGERVAGGVRVKLFGRVEVSAQRIEIAAPAWSRGPPMLQAENARLQLRYRDLWHAYRGETLHVRRIEAQRLDVRLERLADGRASWEFGPPKKPEDKPAQPAAMPVFEELRVRDGRLGLRDAQFDSDVDARFALVDGAELAHETIDRDARLATDARAPSGTAAVPGTAGTPASRPQAASTGASGAATGPAGARARRGEAADPPVAGLIAEATGRYKKLPLKASLRTVGVLPWVSDEQVSKGVPFVVDGSVGRARLMFDGHVRDVQNLAGLGGSFTLAGPSLAAVGDVIGVTLPTTPAFTLRGMLSKDGEIWNTRVDDGRIGRSRLNAALRYDPTQAKPLLAGRVGGSRLLLADLGPAIGTAPIDQDGDRTAAPKVAAPGRVLPDREFDLPSLRAMNADVVFDLKELDLGSERLEPLTPMKAHLKLDDGLLTLTDIDARTADGSLRGELSLDGRQSVAVYKTDLRWNEVRIEKWLQQDRSRDQPPFVAGRFDGSARLQGRGRSTAQILASLDGDLRGRLRDGTISHLIVEAAGLDVAQALGVFVKGDSPLPLNCALADLHVQDGMATPRVLVVDTRDSVVWVEGGVSLVDEKMDLRALVAPRDFSPVSLRTPVRVRGTLGQPAVSVQPGPLVGKVGAAVLLGTLVNPLAAIIPLLDFGSKDTPAAASGCRALVDRVQRAQSPASRTRS